MSHLSLKRFADDDPTLTAGARRDRVKHPYVAVAEMDPSGRASCKLCGEKISKNTLRFGLWLECHKGYRNLCTLHEPCFWQHPETPKLESFQEIHLESNVGQNDAKQVESKFASLLRKQANMAKTAET